MSQGKHKYNVKALPLLVRKLWPRLKFFKNWSNFKVKVTRSWYPWKGLVTRSTHVKYESSTYSSSCVIGQVKVFVHVQRGHRRRGHNNSSPDIPPGKLKMKVLPQGRHICNMKALSLVVWKLRPSLKFIKSRSLRATSMWTLGLWHKHKEYVCETWMAPVATKSKICRSYILTCPTLRGMGCQWSVIKP